MADRGQPFPIATSGFCVILLEETELWQSGGDRPVLIWRRPAGANLAASLNRASASSKATVAGNCAVTSSTRPTSQAVRLFSSICCKRSAVEGPEDQQCRCPRRDHVVPAGNIGLADRGGDALGNLVLPMPVIFAGVGVRHFATPRPRGWNTAPLHASPARGRPGASTTSRPRSGSWRCPARTLPY